MYDDELDMALESAYDDGYVQALLDMGIDPDEIVEEDVDMFDDNYFDEAMEGNPENKAKKNAYIASHGGRSAHHVSALDDPKMLPRRPSYDKGLWRDIELKQHGAIRDQYESRKRPLTGTKATVSNEQKKDLLRNMARDAYQETKGSRSDKINTGFRAVHRTRFETEPLRRLENGDYYQQVYAKSRW